MKRIPLVCLTLLMTALAMGSQASAKDDTAQFKALIDQLYKGWGTLNPDNAAALYAKDPDLVFYDLAPLKYTGWTDYDQGVRKIFGGFEGITLTAKDDLKLTRHKDIAWTTLTAHVIARQKTSGLMEMDVRHTLIWEKRKGKWLIVHEHISMPIPE